MQGPGEFQGHVVLPDGIAAEYYDHGPVLAGTRIAFKVMGLSLNKGNRNSWIVLFVVFGMLIILALTRLRPVKDHEQTITK